MTKLLIGLTLLGAMSSFAGRYEYAAKNAEDFTINQMISTELLAEYSDSTPLDRSVYHNRKDTREVRQHNPLSVCSDHKKHLVAKAFNVDDVKCTFNPYSKRYINQKVRELEEIGVVEVLKVVNDEEIFWILN